MVNEFDQGEGTLIWFDDEFHQATGMVMVQLGVDVDEAIQRLVEYADAAHWPLEVVSAGVVRQTIALTNR